MTDGPIRSSGQPGKTEPRLCEILDSWPNISDVSNKERDSEADGGLKNQLQVHILAKKKKKKSIKKNPTQINSVHHCIVFIFIYTFCQ